MNHCRSILSMVVALASASADVPSFAGEGKAGAGVGKLNRM